MQGKAKFSIHLLTKWFVLLSMNSGINNNLIILIYNKKMSVQYGLIRSNNTFSVVPLVE